MTPDQHQPTNSTPNETDEAQSRTGQQPASNDTAATPEPTQPTSTQGHMGDGAGQRGGYGDSDQTNGMEGAEQPKTDQKA